MGAQKEDNQRFKIWLSQAKYDLDAAKLSFENSFYEWACYQSIQSVEKALKSVIVHSGFRPPRTHKLGVLVGMSNKANNLFVEVKFKFRKIESYTFISRYPFVYPEQTTTPHEWIDKNDAENCLEIAQDIYNKINNFISKQKFQPTEGEEVISTEKYYFKKEEINSRIEEVKNKLLECKDLDIHKIILFGSFAREKTRPRTTTMDILVIANTQLPFIERIEYVREVTRGSEPIIEPLVYTPEEFNLMHDEEGEGFIESAIDEGKVIWEKETQI